MSGVVFSTARFFNHPPVKENIKETLGYITFFGGLALLFKMARAPKPQPELTTAEKAVSYFLSLSIVLSCLSSRPGLRLCDKIFHQVATDSTWQSFFGPNTIFAVNPSHPRHLLNVIANLFALFAPFKAIFNWYTSSEERQKLVVGLGVFNLLTGRCTLHLANASFRLAFK